MVYMREGDTLDVEVGDQEIKIMVGPTPVVDVEITTDSPDHVSMYVNGEPWGPIVERS